MKVKRMKYIFCNSYKNSRALGYSRITSIKKAYVVYCSCIFTKRQFSYIVDNIYPVLEDLKKAMLERAR